MHYMSQLNGIILFFGKKVTFFVRNKLNYILHNFCLYICISRYLKLLLFIYFDLYLMNRDRTTDIYANI